MSEAGDQGPGTGARAQGLSLVANPMDQAPKTRNMNTVPEFTAQLLQKNVPLFTNPSRRFAPQSGRCRPPQLCISNGPSGSVPHGTLGLLDYFSGPQSRRSPLTGG